MQVRLDSDFNPATEFRIVLVHDDGTEWRGVPALALVRLIGATALRHDGFLFRAIRRELGETEFASTARVKRAEAVEAALRNLVACLPDGSLVSCGPQRVQRLIDAVRAANNALALVP